MIKKIVMDKTHTNWYRLFCANNQDSITINLEEGVNVLCAKNGEGKSTIMGAINEKAFIDEIHGIEIIWNHKKDIYGKGVYFFSVNGLAPDRQMKNLNPNDLDGIAMWLGRSCMSHGQENRELFNDMSTLSEGAGCIFIDEPELALDPENLDKFIKDVIRIGKKTQIVIISHHPWIVLNKKFNVIELNGTTNYQDLMKKINTKHLN